MFLRAVVLTSFSLLRFPLYQHSSTLPGFTKQRSMKVSRVWGALGSVAPR